MTTPAPPSSADAHAAILAVHHAFYDAFTEQDLSRMAAVWSRSAGDTCIHPGWEILRGWRAIHAAWLSIFASTPYIRIETADVTISMQGDAVAWVTCTEHIYMVLDQQVDHSPVAATNIFVRQDDRWCLVHHHGSPIAREVTADADADADDTPEEGDIN